MILRPWSTEYGKNDAQVVTQVPFRASGGMGQPPKDAVTLVPRNMERTCALGLGLPFSRFCPHRLHTSRGAMSLEDLLPSTGLRGWKVIDRVEIFDARGLVRSHPCQSPLNSLCEHYRAYNVNHLLTSGVCDCYGA